MLELLRRLFSGPDVKLHAYTKTDGSFDYDAYRFEQENGNKRKIDLVWVQEENIALLSKYIKHRLPQVSFGVCHGTRRGNEQSWFRKYLQCEVIGTEIASSATQFPYTVQWDFHDVNPDWVGKADFVYSNSFDHAYDPKKALNSWMGSLKPRGLCIIEHSAAHGPKNVKALDPFGAKLSVMPDLVREWGEGRFAIMDQFHGIVKKGSLEMTYLVIENM